jgi:hypothetical protein
MKKLDVYSFKDRLPLDGENIFLWGETNAYGDSYVNARFIKIEYTIEEMDENGYATGTQFMYDPENPIPEGCRLVLINGETGFAIGSEDGTDAYYSKEDDILNVYKAST